VHSYWDKNKNIRLTGDREVGITSMYQLCLSVLQNYFFEL